MNEPTDGNPATTQSSGVNRGSAAQDKDTSNLALYSVEPVTAPRTSEGVELQKDDHGASLLRVDPSAPVSAEPLTNKVIYVAEQGCYENRGFAGAFTTLELAKAAFKAKEWTNLGVTIRQGYVGHGRECWVNGLDWDDYVSITPEELIGSGTESLSEASTGTAQERSAKENSQSVHQEAQTSQPKGLHEERVLDGNSVAGAVAGGSAAADRRVDQLAGVANEVDAQTSQQHEKVCVHGHTKRTVGCVSCVLLFTEDAQTSAPSPLPATPAQVTHDIGDDKRAAIYRSLSESYSTVTPALTAAQIHHLSLFGAAAVRALLYELGMLDDMAAERSPQAVPEAGWQQRAVSAEKRVEYLEKVFLPHARSQSNADGFQKGWHGALSRVSEGDAVADLQQLLPAAPPSEGGHK